MVKQLPYTCSFPEQWMPVDPQFDYELVPFNPEGMKFHLIASEIKQSLKYIEIENIFQIQNPYLWLKYDM